MFCINCGAELQNNSSYCTKCGHKIGQAKINVVTEKQALIDANVLRSIIFVFVLGFIVIGSFLPVIKIKLYNETLYHNVYEYFFQIIKLSGEGREMSCQCEYICIGIINCIVILVILALVSGVVAICGYNRKKKIDTSLSVFLASMQIIAAMVVAVVLFGIIYGEIFFLYYNYVWGEMYSTERTFTWWLFLWFISPVIASKLWRKHPYKLKFEHVEEQNNVPGVGA